MQNEHTGRLVMQMNMDKTKMNEVQVLSIEFQILVLNDRLLLLHYLCSGKPSAPCTESTMSTPWGYAEHNGKDYI